MSDPTAGMRSGYAESQGIKRTSKAKFGQAKGIQAKVNKAVVMHFLLFLLIGILMGLAVFIPFYTTSSYSVLKTLFIGFFVLGLLLGHWHKTRMLKKIDWAPSGKFFPRFFLSLAVYLAVFSGILLMLMVLPKIIPSYVSETNFSISALLAASTISILLPFLINEAFEYAAEIESKEYKYWEFPQNYIEKQPTWNRDRVIYSNLNFRRKENENFVTTVKVKLPKEANFGELIYLFMRDYNENRSPENPIGELTPQQGTLGWFFKTENSGITKVLKKKRFIDTELTVEDNGIQEDCHIYFERIQNQDY
ncbi:TssN family type VI secretion system protein [Cryomorpha ignava]|uniref:TssN family type VI secretion system protein n=1 Tax=Cryomorpha ignava TaxID=101383 RepID=A0A7K3WSF1_9FLAO|nr:TssN family type VI secretion system protein [Cryomorpha ignava]NEN23575.1 TssN family type VI secretion system protein [Cryomorpha ignava]